MTTMHFEALARALRLIRPDNANQLLQWQRDVMAVAGVCEWHNERFKLDSFLKACGYTQENLNK